MYGGSLARRTLIPILISSPFRPQKAARFALRNSNTESTANAPVRVPTPVVQWLERLSYQQLVEGSIPSRGTTLQNRR